MAGTGRTPLQRSGFQLQKYRQTVRGIRGVSPEEEQEGYGVGIRVCTTFVAAFGAIRRALTIQLCTTNVRF